MKEPHPSEIELRAAFVVDEAVLYDALVRYAVIHKVTRKPRIILMTIGLALALVLLTRPSSVMVLGAVLNFAIWTYIAWMQPRNLARMAVKIGRTEPGLLGEHVVEVSREILLEATSVNRSLHAIHAMEGFDCLDHVLILRFSATRVLPIPRNADFGRHSFETFSEKLVALWTQARQSLRTNDDLARLTPSGST